MTTDRYQGSAEWYEEANRPAVDGNQLEIHSLLGDGRGMCLDVGCGTGHYFATIAATGRTPVGVDLSADQLRVARASSLNPLVQADVARLPFHDQSFESVLAVWVSSDVDDFAAVLREVHRVLRHGGAVVFLGVHPCFNGPHVSSATDSSRLIHPTYRQAGWHRSSSWWKADGIRARYGMRHLPLAEYLNAFLDSGLTMQHIVEPGTRDAVPHALAVKAARLD
jgi:ubiquinone/menaquinone biosynthesis C-methylase UbiE